MPHLIKPEPAVESNRIDYKCVAVPFPDRKTQPRWIRVLARFATIEKHLTVQAEGLVQNDE